MIATCIRIGTKVQISWRGRNLMKANVNVILMVAQVLWSPWDLFQLFKRSLDYKLRYKHFVSDGDSSTLASLMKEKPYGEDCEIVKEYRIGHIQK